MIDTTETGRTLLVQLVRDGLVTTIGVPTDPEDRGDELATAVGVVKLLKAVHGERVDDVLEAMAEYRAGDINGLFDVQNMN